MSKPVVSVGQFHFQDERISYGRSYELLMDVLMKQMPEAKTFCASSIILGNGVKYLSQT